MKFFRLIVQLVVIKFVESAYQLRFCESQKFEDETVVKNVTVKRSEAEFGDCKSKEFGLHCDWEEWELLEVSKSVLQTVKNFRHFPSNFL
jgi:hypothetical protein